MRDRKEVVTDLAYHIVLEHLTQDIEHDFFFENSDVLDASDEFEDPDLWLDVEKKTYKILRKLTKRFEAGN